MKTDKIIETLRSNGNEIIIEVLGCGLIAIRFMEGSNPTYGRCEKC